MYSIIKKTLSALLVLCLVTATSTFTAFAVSDDNTGIHIPEIEISVYSPITDMLGCELSVNAQILFALTAHDSVRTQISGINQAPCEDVLTAHNKKINSIFALIYDYGINNLQDLSALRSSLQNECNIPSIQRNACSGGCIAYPVWVTINGVTRPGFACLRCGRVVII